jgi:hypothetical protein
MITDTLDDTDHARSNVRGADSQLRIDSEDNPLGATLNEASRSRPETVTRIAFTPPLFVERRTPYAKDASRE